MAVQAELVYRLPQLRIVVRAVHIVAIEAGYSTAVHHALDEIVSLHAVFVSGTIWEMREGLFAELVLFESPEISQILAWVVPDRPVVIVALDRICERPAL